MAAGAVLPGNGATSMSMEGGAAGRDALARARKAAFGGFVYAAFLSAVISLLSLTLPLFGMQVYDRVMSSQSMDTLLMLTLLAGSALAISGALDFIRSLTFQAVADMALRSLSGPALEAAVANAAQRGASQASQALTHLTEIRSFIVGGAVAVPLEAMWTPLLFVALFAIHPLYGLIACVSAGMLTLVGLASDLLTRRAVQQANAAGARNLAEIGASLRHAEVIEAMGMLPALGRRWQQLQHQALTRFDTANRRSRAVLAGTPRPALGHAGVECCAPARSSW